ncbi:hypothetical protein BH10PAT3_BH10PAT3_5610 [soil metagenome]
MAYYSDEDRKRAAAKRKLNSQFRQLMKSPEDAYDILGVSVPKVSQKPQLSDYGLLNDIEQTIENMDSKSVHEKKANRQTIFWSILIILTAICAYYAGIGTTLGMLLALSIFIAGFYFAITDVKPTQTTLHKQYNDYKTQMGYYDYWQRKKSKDHWNTMTGHGFEQAVANLFRNIGFTAEVSNRGGDGGIDIILQNARRRIAVQCKRYKSTVGPHVIRDLWGTMNYLGFDEGCIVTTTGFTKSVTDFAKDKRIFLIDLNDILKATGDNEGVYLRRQIGES